MPADGKTVSTIWVFPGKPLHGHQERGGRGGGNPQAYGPVPGKPAQEDWGQPGRPVLGLQKGVVLDYGTGEEHPISLPKSDVLYFDLEDGAWCCVRPSGTEPKVKFYMGVRGRCREDAEEKLDKLTKAVMALAQV